MRAPRPLDLDEPYYRRLIARFEALAPTRVLDAEHAAAAPVPAHAAAAGGGEPGTLVLIGFELPQELALPAAVLDRGLERAIDGGLRNARRCCAASPITRRRAC